MMPLCYRLSTMSHRAGDSLFQCVTALSSVQDERHGRESGENADSWEERPRSSDSEPRLNLESEDTCGFQTSLLSLVNDLDCGDGGVVHNRVKCEIEPALRRRSQVIEGLREGVKAADLFKDVEIVEQCGAIAVDTKYPASNSNLPGRVRYPIQLGKMKHERITAARVDGNGIGEMPVTLLSVEFWFGSAADLARRIGYHSILEIIVGMHKVPL